MVQYELEQKHIVFSDECECTYNGMIWPILETMKHKIKDEHQNIILISGRTGTGKSEFAFQIAKYLDHNFSLKDVYWTTDDLINAARSESDMKPPGTVFIFDEAREGTQSLNAMSETNRKMGLFLDTIRSRRYHIILLQPSYFLFQRQIAVYSSDILFHIEKMGNDDFIKQIEEGKLGDEITEKPFVRGYGRVYDFENKKKLYIKGKRDEEMDAAPAATFKFKKSKGIIDWSEYNKLKNKAVEAMNEAENKSGQDKPLSLNTQKVIFVKTKAYTLLKEKYGWSLDMIAKEFEDSYYNVGSYISKGIPEDKPLVAK